MVQEIGDYPKLLVVPKEVGHCPTQCGRPWIVLYGILRRGETGVQVTLPSTLALFPMFSGSQVVAAAAERSAENRLRGGGGGWGQAGAVKVSYSYWKEKRTYVQYNYTTDIYI